MASSRNQAGLTLLELLVVLVLAGLITTLMMQGFGFALSLYQQVEKRQGIAAKEMLASRWFRDVNESLIPSKIPGQSLVGSKTKFNATTLMPLLDESGVPVQIEWQLERRGEKTTLLYREKNQELETRINLSPLSILQYKNHKGAWLDEWPADIDTYNLPGAIRIQGPDGAVQIVYIQTRLKPDFLLDASLE